MLGAVFSVAPDRAAPSSATSAKSREYELVLRAPGDSALEGLTHLTLAEIEPGESLRGPTPGSESSLGWAGFELAQLDGTTDDSPLAADRLQFVFSERPESVSPVEYDEYYQEHLRENLQMESFSAGWRWRITPIHLDSSRQPPGSHLALYRMEKGWSEAGQEVSTHSARLRETWPAWFTHMRLSAISATAL